jgi:hypothetical protein
MLSKINFQTVYIAIIAIVFLSVIFLIVRNYSSKKKGKATKRKKEREIWSWRDNFACLLDPKEIKKAKMAYKKRMFDKETAELEEAQALSEERIAKSRGRKVHAESMEAAYAYDRDQFIRNNGGDPKAKVEEQGFWGKLLNNLIKIPGKILYLPFKHYAISMISVTIFLIIVAFQISKP